MYSKDGLSIGYSGTKDVQNCGEIEYFLLIIKIKTAKRHVIRCEFCKILVYMFLLPVTNFNLLNLT